MSKQRRIACADCGESYTVFTPPTDVSVDWVCPSCRTETEIVTAPTETIRQSGEVTTLWGFACPNCGTRLKVYGERAAVEERMHTCPNCTQEVRLEDQLLEATTHGRVDPKDVYLFDTRDRTTIEGDLYIATGNTPAGALQSVHGRTGDRDRMRLTVERGETRYGITYLGVWSEECRSGRESWLMTGVRRIIVQPRIPLEQQQEIREGVRTRVMGDREIVCLDPGCGGYGPYLPGESEGVDGSGVVCPVCGKSTVAVVDSDKILDLDN